ncbi:MAG: glycosyltransferase family 39 protein [Opitutaceae bacterium]
MIRSLVELLRPIDRDQRRRQLLFLAAGIAAAFLGFVAVGPVTAERLIAGYGYYYILGLFVLFVGFAWRVARARPTWRRWLCQPGWPAVAIILAAGLAIWSDPLKHKILYDEYVLQGTAAQMHATKEIGTAVRAYDIFGTWVPIDLFLDKRPYFFAFLVSLLHDLTGFRVANMFVLNVALAPVFVGLVYWLAATLTGRRGPATLAMALLATMPLLGQQVTGAGMELHNVTMLALVMALAILYLRAPDDDRLSLLVLGAVLLSQSRYESVIFVVPTALVIVLGWVRIKRVLLPWTALIAPLLLVPYAWHNRVLSAKPALWQLREGETTRFALSYLAGNLRAAGKFFFNTSVELANSWWLSALGAVALVWILIRALRWLRDPARRDLTASELVVLVFGAGIIGNLTMLMFYYWSRLDEVIASRFALPLYFLLALLGARLACDLDSRRLPGTKLAVFGLGAWFFVFGLPAVARRPYTDQNLVMHEVEWTREMVTSRAHSVLLITNSSTIPFVLSRIPTVLIGAARNRGEQIRFHLDEGTFQEAIVAQAIRPVSAQGETGVDPDDLLPPSFHLQTIEQKRFGGRWLRISRIVSIDPPASAEGAAPSVAEPASARRSTELQ